MREPGHITHIDSPYIVPSGDKSALGDMNMQWQSVWLVLACVPPDARFIPLLHSKQKNKSNEPQHYLIKSFVLSAWKKERGEKLCILEKLIKQNEFNIWNAWYCRSDWNVFCWQYLQTGRLVLKAKMWCQRLQLLEISRFSFSLMCTVSCTINPMCLVPPLQQHAQFPLFIAVNATCIHVTWKMDSPMAWCSYLEIKYWLKNLMSIIIMFFLFHAFSLFSPNNKTYILHAWCCIYVFTNLF